MIFAHSFSCGFVCQKGRNCGTQPRIPAQFLSKVCHHRYSAAKSSVAEESHARFRGATRRNAAEVHGGGSECFQVFRAFAASAEPPSRCRNRAGSCGQSEIVLRSVCVDALALLFQSRSDQSAWHSEGQWSSEGSREVGGSQNVVWFVERGRKCVRCPTVGTDDPRVVRATHAAAKESRGPSPQTTHCGGRDSAAGIAQDGLGVVECRRQQSRALALAFRGVQIGSCGGKDHACDRLGEESHARNAGGGAVLRDGSGLRAVSPVSGDHRQGLVVLVLRTTK